jgi:serralysin
VISGASATLESAESILHQDLNGDGVIGVPAPVVSSIEAFGSTSLVEVGNQFAFYTGGTGPTLKDGGAPVTDGQHGAWTPIGVEQTAGGYELVWKFGSADQYNIWNTDGSGNQLSKGAVVSGASATVESAESILHQDLNGDGVVGVPSPTMIETFGSTSLVELGDQFYFAGSTSNAALKSAGAPVVAGEYGDWMPIAVEQTTSGYELVWKLGAADQYVIWNTDSSGNLVSMGAVGPGASATVQLAETTLHQEINGDGVIGVTAATVPASTLADAAFSHLHAGFIIH